MDRRQFVQALAITAAAKSLPTYAAVPLERVAVIIRSREVTGALPHIWEECVGSDRAAITLRDSWRRDIDRARAELGIKRVRFHGIFNDELVLLRQVYPYENVGISNMIGTPTNDVFLDK